MYGTGGDMVPIEQPQELYDKLQQAGVPVSFVKLGACLSNAKSDASPTISCAWLRCESQYVAMKMITRTRS